MSILKNFIGLEFDSSKLLILSSSNFSKINQDKMFSDGAEIYDWIKKRGYSKIIVIGYSFGCAASIGLANKREIDDTNRSILVYKHR